VVSVNLAVCIYEVSSTAVQRTLRPGDGTPRRASRPYIAVGQNRLRSRDQVTRGDVGWSECEPTSPAACEDQSRSCCR
jgi:hypothetical protein